MTVDPHAIRARLAGREQLAELHELAAERELLDGDPPESAGAGYGCADAGHGSPVPAADSMPTWRHPPILADWLGDAD